MCCLDVALLARTPGAVHSREASHSRPFLEIGTGIDTVGSFIAILGIGICGRASGGSPANVWIKI